MMTVLTQVGALLVACKTLPTFFMKILGKRAASVSSETELQPRPRMESSDSINVDHVVVFPRLNTRRPRF